MKRVQIFGTDGNKYRTSDGLKIAINNAEHRVNSWAWSDGEFLLGGQQSSSRVPYIPMGNVEIVLACPSYKINGNYFSWYSGYEIFSDKKYTGNTKYTEYASDKLILRTIYEECERFVTDGKNNYYLVIKNGTLPDYTIKSLTNTKKWDMKGEFYDSVIDKNGDVVWFHSDETADSITNLKMLKNGETVKIFLNDIIGGDAAIAAVNEFKNGLKVSAHGEPHDTKNLRKYLLTDQVPQAWLDNGLKPGRYCYGLEKTDHSWGEELSLYVNNQTVYSLPPGNGWVKVAKYIAYCTYKNGYSMKMLDERDVVVSIGSVGKDEGRTWGKFGADESEYLIFKNCKSGVSVSYNLGYEGVVFKEVGSGSETIVKPFWMPEIKIVGINEKGENVIDFSQAAYCGTGNGETYVFTVDMSRYTEEPSFCTYTMTTNKSLIVGEFPLMPSESYDFNDYGYKVKDSIAYYKNTKIGTIPNGYDWRYLVYHDKRNMYFLEGATITAINSAGGIVAKDLPKVPIKCRWIKNKKAEKTVEELIK